ncbi:MAG: ATP-binding protein [Candidatus Kapabacteria bacterium]|nr:ATP-binding protein [Candidatus Kapabacteria bacterium]MDW8011983.1 ATP-binding protein [Bacteroidota bacterium]
MLHNQHEQYIHLLELHCDLLQREIEHLRQRITQDAVIRTGVSPEAIGELLHSTSVPEIFHHSCQLIQTWTGASDVYALRLRPDGALEVYPPEHTEHARALVEEGIVDWAVKHGTSALLPELFGAGSSFLFLIPLERDRLGALVALGVPATLSVDSLPADPSSFGLLVQVLVDNAESAQTVALLQAELRRLRQECRGTEALATSDRITSIVLHEISNPLQALLSHAELIEGSTEEAAEHARCIRKELLRLQTLIGELRSLLQRSAPAPLAPVDVVPILQRTLQFLYPQFQRDRIRIHLEVAAETTTILGNPERLEQAFLNLFLNARNAMPQGGTLLVSLRLEGTTLVIECSNTGVGIPSEALAHVFDPPTQLSPTAQGSDSTLYARLFGNMGEASVLLPRAG